MTIRNRLPDLLKRHGLSAYRIEQELRGVVARNSIYALARGETKRIDLDTLDHVVRVLRRQTGQPYNVGDVFDFEE